MRIKALITLVVSVGHEIAPGKEYDLDDACAKNLIERGFAVEIKPAAKAQPTKKEDTGDKNGPTSQKGGG